MPDKKGSAGSNKAKASTIAKNKYNSINYDSLRIIVPKGKKEKIKVAAKSAGYNSINSFVNSAIDKLMKE